MLQSKLAAAQVARKCGHPIVRLQVCLQVAVLRERLAAQMAPEPVPRKIRPVLRTDVLLQGLPLVVPLVALRAFIARLGRSHDNGHRCRGSRPRRCLRIAARRTLLGRLRRLTGGHSICFSTVSLQGCTSFTLGSAATTSASGRPQADGPPCGLVLLVADGFIIFVAGRVRVSIFIAGRRRRGLEAEAHCRLGVVGRERMHFEVHFLREPHSALRTLVQELGAGLPVVAQALRGVERFRANGTLE